MKFIVFILAAVSAWCSATPAYAQQTHITSAAEAPESIQSVTVTARRFHVEPQEFRDYEYEYRLDNGDGVRFSRRVGRFYVAIKGRPTVEIFATAPDQFETWDGAKLAFTEDGDALTIDHYELLQAASGVPFKAVPVAQK